MFPSRTQDQFVHHQALYLDISAVHLGLFPTVRDNNGSSIELIGVHIFNFLTIQRLFLSQEMSSALCRLQYCFKGQVLDLLAELQNIISNSC